MTAAQILVTAAGVAAIAAIVWFFWIKHATGTRAAMSSTGYQETTILVKDGVYTPDTIVVGHGTPVRLTFRREEATPVLGHRRLRRLRQERSTTPRPARHNRVDARRAGTLRIRLPDGHVSRHARRRIDPAAPNDIRADAQCCQP